MGDLSTAIWWIRRDLRLSDNQALTTAMGHASVVIPVFILDPKLLNSPQTAQNRVAFLFEGLEALDSDLRKRGSALFLRKGNPLEVLSNLLRESEATSIFAQADVSPYARQRDEGVRRELPLTLTPGITTHSPELLTKPDGSPYTVFTPFARKWHSLPFPDKPLPAPDWRLELPQVASLNILDLPRRMGMNNFPAGEAEAQRRLEAFTDSDINHYAQARDRMDLDGTSQLSPYMRFGMVSARQAAWAAREAVVRANDSIARMGAETWLNELIWREFYATILDHFPAVLSTAFKPELRSIHWRDDPAGFTAWAEGRTGYPVVDAAMRQLNATGWMHNRARMIAASFLVKDLLIDWRFGERYFMQHLLDGEPASNNGGWQWTAGTGTDSAPYFRVFNPVLQGKKFDPHGNYVRRWVTELGNVPDEYIHMPWLMPGDIQARVGCVIGKNYPSSIVDHVMARKRVLEAYRR